MKIQDGTHFSPKTTEGPFRYLTSKNVRFGYLDVKESGWISSEEHRTIYSRCDVRTGDVLLTKDGANTGNAAINTLEEEFSLLSSVAIIRCDEQALIGRYVLQYLLSAEGQRRLKEGMSGNAITRLTLQKIKAFEIPVPPPKQQRRIADILDAADATIRQTDAVIAKLRQMKAGLLHDLLTRGLDEQGRLRDPAVHPEQFKDSPLGRIPKSWEVVAVSDGLAGIDAGHSPECPDLPAPAGQWGVLKVSSIRPDEFVPEENKTIVDPRIIDLGCEVKVGDLLISRSNTYELVGMACVVRNTRPMLMLCDKTLRLRTKEDVLSKDFLLYVLALPPVRRQIETHATGSSGSMKNISQGTIRNLRFARPPIQEQAAILTVIDAQRQRLQSEEAYRDKLKLQKRGLMHDLLTGRVRV